MAKACQVSDCVSKTACRSFSHSSDARHIPVDDYRILQSGKFLKLVIRNRWLHEDHSVGHRRQTLRGFAFLVAGVVRIRDQNKAAVAGGGILDSGKHLGFGWFSNPGDHQTYRLRSTATQFARANIGSVVQLAGGVLDFGAGQSAHPVRTIERP